MEPMAEEHVNVTPLIDVVMCLIIFFMICGKLAKDEMTGGEVAIPLARLGQEIKEQRGRLVINIVPDTSIPLPAGMDATKPDQKQAVSEFYGRIPPKIWVRGKERSETELVDFLRTEVKDNKDLKVMIRADQAQQYVYVAPILVDCARANIKSVNFSTMELQ
jgi:biopolymer transport protein ExbD